MYSSRGSGGYGQQQGYGGQSGYAQNLGPPYTGSSAGGPDGSSQHSLASRHSSMLGGAQEAEIGGYRSHASATAHYGGQYASVYGSASVSGAQQASVMTSKASGSSALDGHGGYSSAVSDSPKFTSGEYIPTSSRGYGHKTEQLYAEKIPDYPTIDRRQYAERQGAYLGREMQSDPIARYAEPVGLGHQHQAILRQEQLLKSQPMQSASLDGGARQIDYLAARGAASRHLTQDLVSYGGRVDADPRSSSVLTSSSYRGQHTSSILGAAPGRNVDDLLYHSSNSGYGVSLPPGRDYATGKGLHGSSHELDYLGGHPRIDERRDDRASYLREFELREEERRRELLRERERDRERERERERERGRERERDREREREHERRRERERILELREMERERERKRVLENRLEQTPLRASRGLRSLSLTKEAKSSRRDSPSHEASHRRHSPVKEKRREYVCKDFTHKDPTDNVHYYAIHTSSLVDIERDYSSINKRYPRLFISPEFSKVVVNWPKENLKLSIHTPLSFEHDFIEDESLTESKDPSKKVSAKQHGELDGNTIWNAKIILMSGLSRNALEELSSQKSSDDRALHICNILRFAILKKDRSFMAIGGPWDPIDGGDPSIDNSTLIQTALRYAKDVTQLDLQKCHNWNRFLEIHYDRFGKEGFFSHKEVTVLFLPDLSECLPSLDAWREQWLAHKKAVADREPQISLKKDRSKEKIEVQKDEGMDSPKDSKGVERTEKVKDSASCGVTVKEDVSVTKGKAMSLKVDEIDKKVENKDGAEMGDEAKNVDKGESAVVQTVDTMKSGKKKIIRKIVKRVASKTVGDSDTSSAAAGQGVKTTIKKKIIKRVLKRKVPGAKASDGTVETDKEGKVIEAGNDTEAGEKTAFEAENQLDKEKKSVEQTVPNVKSKSPTMAKKTSGPKSDATENKIVKEEKAMEQESNSGTKDDGKADKAKVAQKDSDSGKKGKSKDEEKVKDEKRDKDGNDESSSKAYKEVKEKKKLEEPPRHPGLILQTKGNRESRLRSLSLSLDSLLDYTDKDIEESTFELSLFAESLYEMLQYQMASCLLAFLQKLRIKFIMQRNQRKRDREEIEKDKEKKSTAKRLKTSELPVKNTSADSERLSVDPKILTEADTAGDQKTMNEEDGIAGDKKNMAEDNTTVGQKTMTKEDDAASQVDAGKLENETDDEEDPEEDPEEYPEEYQEMERDSEYNLSNENKKEGEKPMVDATHGPASGAIEVESEETLEKTKMKDTETKPKSDVELFTKDDARAGTGKKEPSEMKAGGVDKELLQAFRFFDRNRTGCIKVEDMRLIIHNMGKFLSHRDVKELVQSALLMSNTGRDDRILYNKLVRMTGI